MFSGRAKRGMGKRGHVWGLRIGGQTAPDGADTLTLALSHQGRERGFVVPAFAGMTLLRPRLGFAWHAHADGAANAPPLRAFFFGFSGAG